MRKLLLTLTLVAFLGNVFAQSPDSFKYQAVVRDANGNIIANKQVGMQMTILQGSASGTSVYQETFAPNTNSYGLVNLEIGSGTVVSGTFASIEWANGPYFIETALDASGGTSYTVMGTSQLMSVPYALHATTAENVLNDNVDDADANPTNEIQALTISNDTIFLSNGGFVKLPTTAVGFSGNYNDLTNVPADLADGDDNTQLDSTQIAGMGFVAGPHTVDTDTKLTETEVDAMVANNGYLTSFTEVDGSLTNEIELPTGGTDGQVLKTDGSGNYAWIDQTVDTDTKLTETEVDAMVNNNGYLTSFTEVDGSVTNEIELPTGGTDGQVLKTDGSGNYAWIDQTVDTDTKLTEAEVDAYVGNNGYLTSFTEVDGSVTNEIELPTGGTNGQVLKTDGSGNYAWVNQTVDTDTKLTEAEVDAFVANNGYSTTDTTLDESEVDAMVANNGYLLTEVDGSITNEIQALSISNDTIFLSNGGFVKLPSGGGAFNTTSNVTSNSVGTYASDDFVFGSSQLNDNGFSLNDNRFYFDKSKGAFRAGAVSDTMWNENYVGLYSIGFGYNTMAVADYSTVLGRNSVATGVGATALGWHTQANGDISTAMGSGARANGDISTAIGQGTNAGGKYAIAMGNSSNASNENSIAIGWAAQSTGHTAFSLGFATQATGEKSMAFGNQSNSSGYGSISMGNNSLSKSYFEIAVGLYNTDYTPNSTTGYNSNDRLFVVGNGTSSSARSNALTIFKNGQMNINDAYNMPTKDGIANQVMTTDGGGNVSWSDVTLPANPTFESVSIDGDGAGPGAPYTLPTSRGTANQVMTTDGSGNVSWATSSGGSASPAGSNTQIQFNDNGIMGSDSNFVYDKNTGHMAIGTDSVNPNAALEIKSTTGAFLLPRLNNEKRDALVPELGMMIYSLASGKFHGYAVGGNYTPVGFYSGGDQVSALISDSRAQSLTLIGDPARDNFITSFELIVFAGTATTATLIIHEGNTTSNPIYQEDFSIDATFGSKNIVISNPVRFTPNTQYTFEIVNCSRDFRVAPSNAYAGGSYFLNHTEDVNKELNIRVFGSYGGWVNLH